MQARKRWSGIALVTLMLTSGSCSKGGDVQRGPSSGTWAKFAAEGRGYLAPAGWTIADPAAGKQEAREAAWCRGLPGTSIAVARLASPGRATEATLLYGATADLERFVEGCFADRRADLRIKFDETFRTTTAAGAAVVVQLGHRDADKASGTPTTLMLAQAKRGDRMFVADAGGLASQFDRSAVMTLIGSVTF
ncbi:MAG: hypothetical protein U0610_00625 [bacterium]